MPNIWVISDTHFNHKNILTFTNAKGLHVRGFDNVSEMNEVMIENWNQCVKPNDKIYHLGDVYFGDDYTAHTILSRLNGKKRLCFGNHDDHHKLKVLNQYFEKTMLWRIFKEDRLLFSHVPVHESVLKEDRFGEKFINVHGHIHANPSPKGPYRNVSVEQTGYRPINVDEL